MKDTNEVIDEFNDIVNMTSSELEKWLKSGDSRSAGWPKDEDGGESVGHDSGRRIVEILKSNPDKDPEKYTDDQISHMRKVVSYCKRHLAQEEKMMQEKSTEEIKETKSYASLKNWGHDPLKKYGDDGEGGDEEDNEEDAEDAEDDNEEEEEDEDEKAGDKRRKSTKDQSGSNKKRETRQGKATSNGKDDDAEDEENEDEDEDEDEDEEENKENGKSNGNGEEGSAKKPKNGPKPGDTVAWNWGNGQPQGKVLDVKGEKTTVTTKRGNEVSRDGDPEDPAVVLDTGKSKAIKSNHELVD